jgi:CTP:molybdopterin cytidylyltransferase MocA
MTAPAIGAAVLAAGASRRLGRPKQLVNVEGQQLVRRIAEVALQSGCQPVAVVLGAHTSEIGAAVADLPIVRLLNPEWAEGMGSSVRVAARWASGAALDALMLVLVDQIRLSTGHLDALRAASDRGLRIAASAYRGVLGVPAIFPRRFFPALQALKGDSGARQLLRGTLPVTAVNWPEGIYDLDRTADLVRMTEPAKLRERP